MKHMVNHSYTMTENVEVLLLTFCSMWIRRKSTFVQYQYVVHRSMECLEDHINEEVPTF